MPITKTGSQITKTGSLTRSLNGLYAGWNSAPTLGFAAMDAASGTASVGGALGGGVGGTLGANLGSKLLSRFGVIGRGIGMLAGGMAGYNAGRNAANAVSKTPKRPTPPKLPGMQQGDPLAPPRPVTPGIYIPDHMHG